MVILGSVAAAFGWGVSDYVGGDVSQRDVPVFVVVAVSELLGVLLLVPVLSAQGQPPPLNRPVLLALLSGISTTVELGLVYRALSRGRALITAPVGALGAVVAVVVGVAAGDPLTVAILLGLACALGGSAISTWNGSDARGVRDLRRGDLAVCLAAAVSVGTTLTTLHAAAHLNPFWVAALQHASTAFASASVAAFVALRPGRRTHCGRTRGLLTRRRVSGLALIAVAGTGGDVSYITASHRGALSIVAALASLYPVTTIALGRVLRGHQATRVQLLGVTIALTGAVLLGAATH